MVLEEGAVREGVLQGHLEYLSAAFQGPAGGGVVRSKPDRESCCSIGKGGIPPWRKSERSPGAGPGTDRWLPHRIHTFDVTILMPLLRLSKEEFNPECC